MLAGDPRRSWVVRTATYPKTPLFLVMPTMIIMPAKSASVFEVDRPHPFLLVQHPQRDGYTGAQEGHDGAVGALGHDRNVAQDEQRGGQNHGVQIHALSLAMSLAASQ
jgi:hypothetical protein